jgi:hypothetical protein
MITLEKVLSELKSETVDEIIGGGDTYNISINCTGCSIGGTLNTVHGSSRPITNTDTPPPPPPPNNYVQVCQWRVDLNGCY